MTSLPPCFSWEHSRAGVLGASAKNVLLPRPIGFPAGESGPQKNASSTESRTARAVVAPLPYLSHLAFRERLYSLHYILKGLKTLSRATYVPPLRPDFVLIDYSDLATFDATSGYYHPNDENDGWKLIPSSDQLLHRFLLRSRWICDSENALTLLRRSENRTDVNSPTTAPKLHVEVGSGNQLISILKEISPAGKSFDVKTIWDFSRERPVFPWMFLRLTRRSDNKQFVLSRGLCGPEVSVWQV